MLPDSSLLNYSLAAFIFCCGTSNAERGGSARRLLTQLSALWLWVRTRRISPADGAAGGLWRGSAGSPTRIAPLVGRAGVYTRMGHAYVQRVCCRAFTLLYIIAILTTDVTVTCSARAIRNAELINSDRFMG